jgi:ATP-dependent metalloprotease
MRLPTLRKRAGDAPQDVEAQRALFNELLESGSEAKDKEELIGRWEELTGLWNTAAKPVPTPILKDDQLFALYLRALASQAATAQDPPSYFSRINESPVKRANVLQGTVEPTVSQASTVAASESTVTPASGPTNETPSGASSITQPSPAVNLSPSALVTALFSGAAGRGKGGDAKVVSTGSFGSWTTPFGAGPTAAAASNGSGPIRVIVEEAKSPLPLRALRFLFVTLLYSFLL